MPTKRKFALKDLWKLQLISDAQIDPGGASILFTRSRFHPDRERNGYESHIWRVSTRGGAPRQWTNSSESESTPRWSPNGGEFLFLSARSAEEEVRGQKQLWVMPSDGGEGLRITERAGGVASAAWSPDGRQIAFVGRVPTDPERDDLETGTPQPAMHIDRLTYRHDLHGYQFGYRNHLFVIPAKGGSPTQITSGDWDVGDYVWTPDGKRLLVCGHTVDADRTYARELHAISVTGRRTKTLCGLDGPISSPSVSPDGKTVAFIGNDFRRGYATNSTLFLVPLSGGTPRNLTRSWDVGIGQTLNTDTRGTSPAFGPTWSPDGAEIKFLTTLKGATHLFAASPESGEVTAYTSGDWAIESLSYSKDHTVAAYTAMTPVEPAELWVWKEGRSAKQLTRANSFLSRLSLAAPKRFQFKASDGVSVEGWVMHPPGSRKKKHPALLEIHGGPRSAYGMGFMHEFQMLNAAGYSVIFINPRGSSSYGEDWACAGPRHYGERDYEDLLQGVDAVLRREPIDRKRLGVLGGSYGGYMTNWIIGHTNRFKAACTQRCISNWLSFFGTSDIGNLFGPQEIGGPVWKDGGRDLRKLWEKSPLAHVEKMVTPLLIVHSENDWRCPIEQGEQLFSALKWLGRDTEFLRVPGESHELSRSGGPLQRIARLEAILDWFGRKL